MGMYRRKLTVVDAEQFTDVESPPRGVRFHGVMHTVETIKVSRCLSALANGSSRNVMARTTIR
jgi:hypothetical protein